MAKKKALGRGLSALMADVTEAEAKAREEVVALCGKFPIYRDF